jgi:hypothetical protein
MPRIVSLIRIGPGPGGLALGSNSGEHQRHGCRCALGSPIASAFDRLQLIVLSLGRETRVGTIRIRTHRIASQASLRTCLSPTLGVADLSERLDAAYKSSNEEKTQRRPYFTPKGRCFQTCRKSRDRGGRGAIYSRCAPLSLAPAARREIPSG